MDPNILEGHPKKQIADSTMPFMQFKNFFPEKNLPGMLV